LEDELTVDQGRVYDPDIQLIKDGKLSSFFLFKSKPLIVVSTTCHTDMTCRGRVIGLAKGLQWVA
jgi:hypothetical protein